jgi:hypothetical protein
MAPRGDLSYQPGAISKGTNKDETHCVCLTVGDNLIQCPGDVLTRSADLTTSKCLWNSTISTEGVRCICLYVKDFYMGYMRTPIKRIPQ